MKMKSCLKTIQRSTSEETLKVQVSTVNSDAGRSDVIVCHCRAVGVSDLVDLWVIMIILCARNTSRSREPEHGTDHVIAICLLSQSAAEKHSQEQKAHKPLRTL